MFLIPPPYLFFFLNNFNGFHYSIFISEQVGPCSENISDPGTELTPVIGQTLKLGLQPNTGVTLGQGCSVICITELNDLKGESAGCF
jgi:hypothetical protein